MSSPLCIEYAGSRRVQRKTQRKYESANMYLVISFFQCNGRHTVEQGRDWRGSNAYKAIAISVRIISLTDLSFMKCSTFPF